jgi:hypothetical protein
MKIAITGTHGSGKTTLIEDFLERFPGDLHEPEPYWAVTQQGIAFADGPTVPDLEQQLEQSVMMVLAHANDPEVIFDRSPVDFLGYPDVISDSEGLSWAPSEKLLDRIEAAIRSLDLLVFLPLSRPDEITDRIEYPRLRRRVDGRLKEILRDDALELFSDQRPRLLELSGTRARRLTQLARHLETSR